MRILRLIFTALVFFLIIIAVTFFTAREILFFLGTSKIKSSLRTLSLSRNRGSFESQCQKLGSVAIGGEKLVTYQLRFLSSKEFVLEAVCDQFSFDPILIEQVTLPQFVTKVPGTSGFSLNSQQSGVKLQVFAEEINKIAKNIKVDLSSLIKTRYLVAQDGVLVPNKGDETVSMGPVTSCNGYGYECCQTSSQVGVGDRITGLVDCEQSCYSSCVARPVVLSFNTDPILDIRQRSLAIKNKDIVEFTHVADAGTQNTVGGILDFGDGKKMPVTGLAGQSSHTYSCRRARCEYLVRLTLEDKWGVESADSKASKIKIIVSK